MPPSRNLELRELFAERYLRRKENSMTIALETRPLSFSKLSSDADGLDDFEIVVAETDYRVTFAGMGNVRGIGRVEWTTKLEQCPTCDEGKIDKDYFGMVTDICYQCGGSGKVQTPVCVLVMEETK